MADISAMLESVKAECGALLHAVWKAGQPPEDTQSALREILW